jgi:hypothetical protein
VFRSQILCGFGQRMWKTKKLLRVRCSSPMEVLRKNV